MARFLIWICDYRIDQLIWVLTLCRILWRIIGTGSPLSLYEGSFVESYVDCIIRFLVETEWEQTFVISKSDTLSGGLEFTETESALGFVLSLEFSSLFLFKEMYPLS